MDFANIHSLFPPPATDRRWAADAACKDLPFEVFFPEEIDEQTGAPRTAKSWREASAEAKTICSSCIVREQCLLYALEAHEQYGVWGGKTTEERYRMLRHSNWRRQQRDKAAVEAQRNGQTAC